MIELPEAVHIADQLNDTVFGKRITGITAGILLTNWHGTTESHRLTLTCLLARLLRKPHPLAVWLK